MGNQQRNIDELTSALEHSLSSINELISAGLITAEQVSDFSQGRRITLLLDLPRPHRPQPAPKEMPRLVKASKPEQAADGSAQQPEGARPVEPAGQSLPARLPEPAPSSSTSPSALKPAGEGKEADMIYTTYLEGLRRSREVASPDRIPLIDKEIRVLTKRGKLF